MSYNIDPSMAANSAAQQDINAHRRAVESLSGNADPVQKQAKLRSACEGFEAVFIQKMWEQMRASLPKEGLMKGKEEEYWQSMYDQELGKSMASSGGIGLADMMMVQLSRNNQEISDATKGSTMRRPELNVSPAPLLPPSANVEHKADTPAVAAKPVATAPASAQAAQPAAPAGSMSIYDGAANPEAPLAPENDNNGNATPNENGATPTANAALASAIVTDDTPASVRQTLDELSLQLGVPSPTAGASAAATDPTVTHITYQTNLPPSQRKAEPARQRGATQPRPLNTAPAEMTGAASSMIIPGNVPGYTPPNPRNTPVTPRTAPPVAQSAPQTLVAQAPPREPDDILSGITPRFIPTRFQTRNTGSAATEAINIARQDYGTRLTENLDGTAIISQTGGPALVAPEEVAVPVAMGNPEPPRNSLSTPVSGELSSGFGWRIDPFTGQRAWHAGVDIKAQPGESVRAAKDGVVTFAGTHPELGNLVVVDHGDGLRTFYGHNQDLEVSVGQHISSGMELAKAGSSGRAAGTHVHFEVRRGELALNPEPLLRQQRLQVAEAN